MTATSQTTGLLTPAEVAQLFRVDPKTVTRWAKAGRVSCIRTLGGHRRYPVREIEELLRADRARAVVPAQQPEPAAVADVEIVEGV